MLRHKCTKEIYIELVHYIAEGIEHSSHEQRHYCFGKLESGIMTVRFTYRDNKIRIIGAGYWRKGKKIYEEAQKS